MSINIYVVWGMGVLSWSDQLRTQQDTAKKRLTLCTSSMFSIGQSVNTMTLYWQNKYSSVRILHRLHKAFVFIIIASDIDYGISFLSHIPLLEVEELSKFCVLIESSYFRKFVKSQESGWQVSASLISCQCSVRMEPPWGQDLGLSPGHCPMTNNMLNKYWMFVIVIGISRKYYLQIDLQRRQQYSIMYESMEHCCDLKFS